MRLRTLLSVTTALFALSVPGAHAQTTQPTSQPAAAQPPAPNRFVREIESAHNKAKWDTGKAISFDIMLTFGEATMLAGTVLYDMHAGRVRIDMAGDTRLVFDGDKAWVSPASAEVPMARFHLLTWPYFIAAPMKLSDPGTRVTIGTLQNINDKLCPTAKLTFEPGIGDSPNDWYQLYADPTNNQLLAMAYIVTYGQPAADAEQDPHAITYTDYHPVDGVPISTTWTFTKWNAQKGIHGEPLGLAKLSNVRFVEPDADAFAKPEDAREDVAP